MVEIEELLVIFRTKIIVNNEQNIQSMTPTVSLLAPIPSNGTGHHNKGQGVRHTSETQHRQDNMSLVQ